MIWRLAKDLLFSALIAVLLLWTALVGLLSERSRASHAWQPESRIRARKIVKRSMEFVLRPVERPRHLVPDFVESIPAVGDASLAAARFVAFPPCFWMAVAFVGIRTNRKLKVVTSERLRDHFDAKFGWLHRQQKSRRSES